MYQISEIQKPLEPLFDSSHITIYCNFDINGTPTDVIDPEFHLYAGTSSGDPEVTEISVLKPVQKDPGQLTGRYVVTFLSNRISAGTYFAVFKGTVDDEEVVVTNELTFNTVSRTQSLIEMLLGSLKGKYNLIVPNNYLAFDPRARQWTDGECYDCLSRAVQDVNTVPPILNTIYTLESCPCTNFMILGAQIYALLAVSALEAVNYFDISTPIRVSMYRGDKVQSVASFIKDMYQEPLRRWKDQQWLNQSDMELALVMNRVPLRIVRPISEELWMHSLSW